MNCCLEKFEALLSFKLQGKLQHILQIKHSKEKENTGLKVNLLLRQNQITLHSLESNDTKTN